MVWRRIYTPFLKKGNGVFLFQVYAINQGRVHVIDSYRYFVTSDVERGSKCYGIY